MQRSGPPGGVFRLRLWAEVEQRAVQTAPTTTKPADAGWAMGHLWAEVEQRAVQTAPTTTKPADAGWAMGQLWAEVEQPAVQTAPTTTKPADAGWAMGHLWAEVEQPAVQTAPTTTKPADAGWAMGQLGCASDCFCRKPLPPGRGCAILLSVWLTRFESLERAALWIWQRLPVPWRARSALYWLVSTKYGIGVQALVFDDAGRLLLLRHTYKGRYPWGLPGGGMSRGETPDGAILREVREEAGLEATVRELLGVEAHSSRLIVEIFYLCEAHGGTFRANAEIADYGYFALTDLPHGLEPRLRRLIYRYAGDGRPAPGPDPGHDSTNYSAG